MRKIILAAFFFCSFSTAIFAQVGIGTNTPNPSSVLELNSTDKAFIPPRMTTVQRDLISNPVAGMEIFNTTTSCIEIYRGTGWYNLCSGAVTLTPTITSFTPVSGAVGTSVTINGTNLTGATVSFNGTVATTSSVTATSITCTVPAGAATGAISVTTTGGTATSSSLFTVTTAGPNLVVGGDMSDASKWTLYPIYPGVKVTFTGGKAIWTGGDSATGAPGGHVGIYQAISVVAGKNYQIDMHVSGSNIKNTWFEVYVGTTAPIVGTDYIVGGKRLSLNTWNCPSTNTTFDAQLSTITCVTGAWNNITFASSGTVYLLIRCGGDDLTLSGGTGITVDDVDFHSTN